MYKVSEVALKCSVSVSAIYKILKQVEDKYTTVHNGKTLITEDGLQYFLERFKTNRSVSDDVVSSLIRQMEEKDKQLAEKDNQINQLIEQSRNFQVLLKTEQDKTLQLSQSKPTFFQRLFGRKINDDSEQE